MKKTLYSILCLLAISTSVYAIMPDEPEQGGISGLPQPPLQNPNPPVTEIDKKRVSFAIEAIKLILEKTPKVLITTPQDTPISRTMMFKNKDLACLKDVKCLEKDQDFAEEMTYSFHNRYGKLAEYRHAHIIPWSIEKTKMNKTVASPMGPSLLEDEYMVHIYVRFSKEPGRWYHLDVILTENAQGEVFLRHFYATPIPNLSSQLPPGVVC